MGRWHWNVLKSGSDNFLLAGLRRVEVAYRQRPPLGIITRLVIAFVGVSSLTLAAAITFQKGILVERTTQITKVINAPSAAVAAAPQTQSPANLIPEETETVPYREITSDSLRTALDRFADATHERAENNGPQSEERYQRALLDLTHSHQQFTNEAASILGRPMDRLIGALHPYEQRADAVIRLSDQRRTLLSQYSDSYEGLNANIKSSLSKSWKIFGRVVARQSLLQLNTELDGLRRAAVRFAAAPHESVTEIEVLRAATTSVRKNLESNETAYRRSEGSPWYDATLGGIVSSSGIFEALVELDGSLIKAGADFAEQGEVFSKVMPKKVATPAVASSRAKRAAAKPAAIHMDIPPLEVSLDEPPAPQIVEHSKESQIPQSAAKRRQALWISAFILVVLLYVAVGTVMSVLRPVRQLMLAMRKVANGEADVAVPRGGIKELDSVAVAFNTMAGELAQARAVAHEYQDGLERRVLERTQQLKHLAERDPLTNLPNRRELFSLLGGAIQRAAQNDKLVGVFFLDIDNFKYINDSMGHAFGDALLVAIAGRLHASCNGVGFAARLGGDEFTVVYESADHADMIRQAGLAIVQGFQLPLAVEGRDLIVSVSVGASIYPLHEREPDALLKAADAALFRAKALGRSQLSVFTPELLEAAAAKFSTEQGLRRAIERGEFELVFQPEVGAESLQTELVEALIRWRMPDGSLASPGHFLAIAEESGLIMEISDWVLKTAIETAAGWYHGAWPGARVAINVTPRQLLDVGFFDRFHSLLASHDLPTKCIELELTESVLQTGPATIEALKRLRDAGVAIALDDFGTGYSSLASLEQLPLTRIKLDRSLIEGLDNSPRAAAIATAIIGMCEGLGLEITAEGIERPAQFAMLVKHRGMYLQGYLLARPTSATDLMSVMGGIPDKCHDLILGESRPNSAESILVDTPRLHAAG
jgi:diguanylate cyclase (GGDEF)-like protein